MTPAQERELRMMHRSTMGIGHRENTSGQSPHRETMMQATAADDFEARMAAVQDPAMELRLRRLQLLKLTA